MMQQGRLLLPLLALLLAGCRPSLAREWTPPPSAATPVVLPTVTAGPVPAVRLPSLDGETVGVEAWRGEGVILNFWATWCYPCRQEMPALADAHSAGEGVVVVGVNLQESEASARAFVEEYAIPFPILLDEQARLGNALGVRGMPTTFFIDAEGRIVGSHIGPLTAEMLAEWVARLRPARVTYPGTDSP